jgi:hypothetical protein
MLATISKQQNSVRPGTHSDTIGNMQARPVAGNQALLRRMQAKLSVSQPGDPAEVEADRVAEQVMRASEPAAGPPATIVGPAGANLMINRKCEGCEEEEKKTLQRKRRSETVAARDTEARVEPGHETGGYGDAGTLVERALGDAGSPMDAATRDFMEAKFGRDFGDVRIHTGSTAGQSARAVDALAYTLGSNVVFRSGEYSPGTESGRRLLAHELTHVIQQTGSGTAAGFAGSPAFAAPAVSRFAPTTIMREPPPLETEQTAPPPPQPAQPAAQPTAAPQPKKATYGKDSDGVSYVVYENEIRWGGTRTWRDNNPGNFDKPDDHPKNIGQDPRFLIFPDPDTGKQELIDDVTNYPTNHPGATVTSLINVHAPPKENDTKKYIEHVVSWTNNGSGIGKCEITKAKNLISDQTPIKDIDDKASFAMAMARQEGWCDVNLKKEIYDCKNAKTPAELKPKLNCP